MFKSGTISVLGTYYQFVCQVAIVKLELKARAYEYLIGERIHPHPSVFMLKFFI